MDDFTNSMTSLGILKNLKLFEKLHLINDNNLLTKYGSVALLWHNAKVLALLKAKCKIH